MPAPLVLLWTPGACIGISGEQLKVALQNPKTGEVKHLQLGWSWLSFFFAPLYGLPLFFKGLVMWGGVVLALSIASDLVDAMTPDGSDVALYANLGMLVEWIVIAVIFGLKANELAGKNYLEKGWVFFEPNSPAATVARARWKIMPVAGDENRATAIAASARHNSSDAKGASSESSAASEPTQPTPTGQPILATATPGGGSADLDMSDPMDRIAAKEKWSKEHSRIILAIRLVIAAMLIFLVADQLYRGMSGGACEGRFSFICQMGRSLAGSHSQASPGQVSEATAPQTVAPQQTMAATPTITPTSAAPAAPAPVQSGESSPTSAAPAGEPAATPAPTAQPESFTPPPGSPERKAIMDAMRPRAEQIAKQPVIFKVVSLTVTGNHAHAVVVPLGQDGQPARPYGQPFTLAADLERNGNGWTLTNMYEDTGDE